MFNQNNYMNEFYLSLIFAGMLAISIGVGIVIYLWGQRYIERFENSIPVDVWIRSEREKFKQKQLIKINKTIQKNVRRAYYRERFA